MELVIKPSAVIGDRLNIDIISFQKGLLKIIIGGVSGISHFGWIPSIKYLMLYHITIVSNRLDIDN